MIRPKKKMVTMENSGHAFSRAEKLYDVRKRIKESLHNDFQRENFSETSASWLENRFREDDASNIYDSME